METVARAAEADPILTRAACHEAGHALVACVLRIPFACVTLGIEGESAGRVQGIEYPDEAPVDPGRVEEFLTYLAAGAAAVELLCGPEVVSGSSEDRLQAEYWAARAFPRPAEYARALNQARARARQILRSRRAALEAVVAALLEGRALTAEQVLRLLGPAGEAREDR
jgi:ATP-dependent Zn protease